MPLPTEYQDFNNNSSLLNNDKGAVDLLRQIMSRNSFAPNLRSYTIASTLDPRVLFAICDTTAGAFNLTLPQANYHGSSKTPFYIIHHLAGAGAFNVAPSGADTINGVGAPFAIAVGGFYLFISNGNNAWYARAI
jgi:hypothetical protein